MEYLFSQLDALVPILAGICCILLVYKVIPIRLEPEKAEAWYRKYGRILKIIGPLLIILGVIRLL